LELTEDQRNAVTFETELIVTEFTGSDTFIHIGAMNERWIGLVPGLHNFEIGQMLSVSLNPQEIFYFDKNDMLVGSPAHDFDMVEA